MSVEILNDMVVLMACGHTTQAVDEDRKPVCMICFPNGNEKHYAKLTRRRKLRRKCILVFSGLAIASIYGLVVYIITYCMIRGIL